MDNSLIEDLHDLVEDKDNIILDSKIENNELRSDETIYTLPLRIDSIDDEKELTRFIKSCEALIRKCPEYKIWTKYIRDVLGYVSCDLTKESHNQCTCDIHHHPISLYTITKGVISQFIASSKKFCSADIITQVLELHFQNRVSIISLIQSLHQKFHNGFLNLPMELVHGDYKYFMNHYSSYLDDSDLETIQSRLAIKFDNCGFGNNYCWVKDGYLDKDIDLEEISNGKY